MSIHVDIEEIFLHSILEILLGGRPDHHWHMCESCLHIWEHDRPRNVSEEEYDKAHCCPKCSKGPYRTAYPTASLAKDVQAHYRRMNHGRQRSTRPRSSAH